MKRCKLFFAAACLLAGWISLSAAGPQRNAVVPLESAHAHNDYWHDRPLWDALEQGFCSVEADIFLVDGALLVGHDRSELKTDRTLESLYLRPLRERVEQNDGRVHAGGPHFTLMIDIKTAGEETYRALARILSQYGDILTSVTDGREKPGAVRVIVSGNRAFEVIAADSPRYAGIDGRLSDLDSDLPAHLLPLISDNWRLHFRWQGDGEMPEAERTRLRSIIQQARDRGRRVRFWATPENENLWKELHAAGVDLLNTDDLPRLARFLRSRQSDANAAP